MMKAVFAALLLCLGSASCGPVSSTDYMRALSHNSLKCVYDIMEAWKNSTLAEVCPDNVTVGQKASREEDSNNLCNDMHSIFINCMHKEYVAHGCVKEDWSTVCKINADYIFDDCQNPTDPSISECCAKNQQLCEESIPETTVATTLEPTTTTTSAPTTTPSTTTPSTTTVQPTTIPATIQSTTAPVQNPTIEEIWAKIQDLQAQIDQLKRSEQAQNRLIRGNFYRIQKLDETIHVNKPNDQPENEEVGKN